jgi:hypothetical protein
MNDQQKIRCKQVIELYLKQYGWPNMNNPNEFVMQHLRPMFNLLIKEGLVQESDYAGYTMAAQVQFHFAR